MASEFDTVHVGTQLEVAGGVGVGVPGPPPTCLGGGLGMPPKNAFWCEGLTLLGSPLNYPIPGVPEATVMIGPSFQPSAIIPPPLSIFKITNKGSLTGKVVPNPLDVMIGDPGIGMVGITVNSKMINVINATITNYVSPQTNWVGNLTHMGMEEMIGLKALAGTEFIAALKAQFGKEARAGAKCTNGMMKVNGIFMADQVRDTWGNVLAAKKNRPFDMPHPNKKGWRLRHVCIEGPEIAVYCRGKVGEDGIINLPSFWEGLVNIDDMTINLTPRGNWQELYVKEIVDGKQVMVMNNITGGKVNADYHITGRRLDDDLIVEYEGESHEDYPGGNEGYEFSWENDNMERLVKEVVRERLNQMEENE